MPVSNSPQRFHVPLARIHLICLALCCTLIALPSLLEAQISTFPHRSTFEDEQTCFTGCGVNCLLQGTWKNVYTDDNDWARDNGTTPSGGTGPTQDHTFGTTQGYFIYTEASCDNIGYPNMGSDLVSAYFDFSNVTDTVLFSFWFHAYGNHMGICHLDADTTEGQGAWINDIIPAWTDDLNEWQREVVDLGPFMGEDSVRFRFRRITGTDYQGDMALDDLDFFIPQPNDFEVVSFSAPRQGCALSDSEAVTVSVFNHGMDSLFPGDTMRLCYQLGLNNPVTEAFVLMDTLAFGGSLDFTFSQGADLSAVGEYSLSAWTKMSPLGTSHNLQKTIELEHFPSWDQFPYDQDWENGEGLWTIRGLNPSWELGAPSQTVISGAPSGFNAWATGLSTNYNNGEFSHILSPCFDFSGLCRPELKMNIAWDSENTWDGAVVQYSLNGGQSWVRIGNFGDPFNWYTSNDIYIRPGGQSHGWTGTQANNGSGGWVEARRNLYNLAGQQSVLIRLVFESDFDTNFEGFGMDDFIISNGVYLGQDFSICQGDTAYLTADSIAGDNFLWSTGATTSQIAVTGPGSYWVEVSNNSYCTTRDTIEVISIPSNYAINLGADVTACGETTLDAGFVAGFTYIWSNGSTGQFNTVNQSGPYFVTANTPCGMIVSDTQQVTILPLPTVDLGPDSTVCGNVTLDAGAGQSSYLWSDASTAQTLAVTATGSYAVTITGTNGCDNSDTVHINVSGFPGADLGPDTILCAGDTLCLTANPDPSLTYQWTTGALSNSICVTSGGIYIVTVTNADGCPGTDTAIVTTPANPISIINADTSNCPSIAFFGNSIGGPADNFYWDFGDGDTSTAQNPVHVYPGQGLYAVQLIVTNSCGTDTTEIQLPLACEVSLVNPLGAAIATFPNPTSGQLHVRFENTREATAQLRVADLYGKVLMEEEWRGLSPNETRSINLGEWAKGIYFLEVQLGEELIRKRILLQ